MQDVKRYLSEIRESYLAFINQDIFIYKYSKYVCEHFKSMKQMCI